MITVFVVAVLIIGLAAVYLWAKRDKIETISKTAFSSFIAYEASEYLDVDPNEIEENLLNDKIVLKNSKMKPYVVDLGSGRSMTMTGCIDAITFTWGWTIPHGNHCVNPDTHHHASAGFVNNAVVSLTGMKLKVTFSESKANGADDEEEESALYNLMWNQVQKVIDVININIVDFELTLEIPAPEATPKQDDGSQPERNLSVVFGSKSIQLESFGRDKKDHKHHAALEQRLTIDSWLATVNASEPSTNKHVEYPLMDPFSYITQISRVGGTRFEDGVFSGLTVDGHDSTADQVSTTGAGDGIVIHAGVVQTHALTQLCSLFTTSEPSDAETSSTPTVASHTSAPTKKTANGDSIPPTTKNLAKEDSDANGKTLIPSNGGNTKKPAKDVAGTTDTPSVFRVPISSVKILDMDESTVVAGSLDITYKADSTVLNLEVKRFERDAHNQGVSTVISGVHVHMYPTMKLVVDSVESLDLPGVCELTSAVLDSTATFEGDTLCVKLASIEGTKLDSEADKTEHTSKKSSKQKKRSSDNKSAHHRKHFLGRKRSKKTGDGTEKAQEVSSGEQSQDAAPQSTIAFPVKLSIQELAVKGESSGSVMTLGDISCDRTPDDSNRGARNHVRVGNLNSDLIKLKDAKSEAYVNEDDPSTVHSFKFDAHDIHVATGYSIEEWYETLETMLNLHYYLMLIKPPDEWQFSTKKTPPLKMPFAEMPSLKIRISIKGTEVDMKETTVTIHPFHGDANTTSKDLVLFIAKAIARRVPKFITNTDVLNMNLPRQAGAMASADAISDGIAVADGAAGGIGAGVGGGIAVVGAIDLGAAAISLGKTDRGATQDQRYRPGDLCRGLKHAPAALAHVGAAHRHNDSDETSKDENKKGRDKSFAADVAVGAAYSAAQYLVHNRKQLAVAGAGGAGVIIGTALGGPVGGIVIGISASLGTAATADIVEHVSKKAKKKVDDDLSKAHSASVTKTDAKVT